MKPSDEQRISKKMIAAQERIRRCMCKTALAAQWHLEKAASVARKPKLLERVAPHLEGVPAQQYLAALPSWIEQTTRQDAVCGDLWGKQHATYPAQSEHLVAMLLRYDFSLRSYEKLARQTSKMLVETSATPSSSADEIPTESAPRMTAQEADDLQQQIDADLQVLDQARAELIAGHDDLVMKLVQKDVEKTADPVEEVTAYARNALAKAAENFDSRQGRRFATYAQWWIKTAIKEKKTWVK
jgi:hypothetical protein